MSVIAAMGLQSKNTRDQNFSFNLYLMASIRMFTATKLSLSKYGLKVLNLAINLVSPLQRITQSAIIHIGPTLYVKIFRALQIMKMSLRQLKNSFIKQNKNQSKARINF